MNRFLRVMLLLKVMVMLSLGSAAVWAQCDKHEQHASSGQVVESGLLLAADEQKDTGDEEDDGPTTDDEPDDGGDEEDSQS
ncbi:hypothetical protein FBY06_11511 [Pseudomonas sp. SJZ085]|mgnify:CR=1 FL=1|nr:MULTISPECIES: hypothetical protein [unclassified Pseudomonas]TWC18086.1 hypothetical protein FBX99_11511 [Pseudomonas sp. SJZ074]TWC21889.1 hypothetical protein FBY00_10214 [Pseudomonas sp. SJZ075]TWC36058.1 hypothetical protein FBY06_11511 [Pseudomonas sp. SJZ085]TWC37223.1 hypothetical protein FBY02_10214 [Pseudomonas sp. SJZ078]TWC58176.1 hypothetical protein FBY11_102329 [Pseudomonas sp. SJZ124]